MNKPWWRRAEIEYRRYQEERGRAALEILRDIWERRATVHEAGNNYAVHLDGELCERIRAVLEIGGSDDV